MKKLERPKTYAKYTAKEREAIVTYAENHSTAAAVRKYRALFPRLNESTVRTFRKNIKNRGSGELKDRTRPLLLGRELDNEVKRRLTSLRENGGVVNTSIAVATATGIVKRKAPHLLKQNGGHLEISKSWAQSFFRRTGFCKRHATTGKLPLPQPFILEQRKRFAQEIGRLAAEHSIPETMIINWDQTPLKYVPTGQWTMDKRGSSKVSIAGLNDKRAITAVITCTAAGDMLPLQLIYPGKTDKCHPVAALPSGTDVTHNVSHFSTEATMLRYMDNIIAPYLQKQREELSKPDTPGLLVYDVFRAHTTDAVQQKIRDLNCLPVCVPPNMTDHLQPLDLAVNKPIKDFLKGKFIEWYSEEVESSEDLQPAGCAEGHLAGVLKSVVTLRNMHASWLAELHMHFKQSPQQEIIRNGFRAAGIYDAIANAPATDDPFVDLAE